MKKNVIFLLTVSVALLSMTRSSANDSPPDIPKYEQKDCIVKVSDVAEQNFTVAAMQPVYVFSEVTIEAPISKIGGENVSKHFCFDKAVSISNSVTAVALRETRSYLFDFSKRTYSNSKYIYYVPAWRSLKDKLPTNSDHKKIISPQKTE